MRLSLALLFALLAGPATADGPLAVDQVTIRYYGVAGDTLPALAALLDEKGPRGYWAWTDTRWRWDANCNVRFTAVITLPNLHLSSRLTDSDQAEWDRMTAALLAHEMEHVAIGRSTAQAIKAARCRVNPLTYYRRARAANAALDARTDHGIKTGATLKD